nr:AAA family ATPase [uncultured Butyrivibrio sp.]
MKLVAYRIENFKSFVDSGWIEFNKLLLFYGNNSAGKSAIHQSLLLLRNAYEIEQRQQKVYSIAELDGTKARIEDFINKKHLNEGMNILFKFIDNEHDFVYGLHFEISNGKEIEKLILFDKEKEIDLSEYYEPDNVFFVSKRTVLPDDEYKQIIFEIMTELRRFADAFMDINPIRRSPEREFVFHNTEITDLGRAGENSYAKLYSLIENNELKNKFLSNWISEFGFKLEWRYIAQNQGKFVLIDSKSGIESNLVDNGFGIGQSLPVVVALATAQDKCLLVDSPEAFLQTNMQTKIADYIIGSASNNMLMVETSSEYLLNRVRRRIAEKKLSNKEVNVIFIHDVEGESVCEKLEIDDTGEIQRQSEEFKQFFSSDYEDVMAILLAKGGKNFG